MILTDLQVNEAVVVHFYRGAGDTRLRHPNPESAASRHLRDAAAFRSHDVALPGIQQRFSTQ